MPPMDIRFDYERMKSCELLVLLARAVGVPVGQRSGAVDWRKRKKYKQISLYPEVMGEMDGDDSDFQEERSLQRSVHLKKDNPSKHSSQKCEKRRAFTEIG